MPSRLADLFAAARNHVKKLDKQIAALTAEKNAVLREAGRLAGAVSQRLQSGSAAAPRKRGRRASGSLVDAIVAALRGSSAGLEISEILKKLPGRHESKAISSAITQHLKGKKPRIKVVKRGGKGVPSKYGAA